MNKTKYLPFIFFLLLIFTNTLAQNTYFDREEWIRNGPFSAHVISLAIASSDTNVIYVGTYCDGVYKSIDGAENWFQCSTENLPTWDDSLDNSPTLPCWWFGNYYPIESIGIDPTNSEHVWTGTGGRGLFESNDGGNSWQKANETLPDSLDVDFIYINENNPDEIFIGAGTGFQVPPLDNGGLYHTIDVGTNWTLIDSVPYGDTYHITCITNEPGNEEHLYVGIGSAGEPGFSWGLMESVDGGNQWQILTDDYPIYSLFVNPENNQNMWSIIYTGWLDWVLASSTDGGYTWTAYPDWNNPELWITSLYADVEYNLYYAQYTGGSGSGWGLGIIKKSTNNGSSWVTIDSLCAGRGVILRNRCEANQQNVENIYFGTLCGVYKSNDGGYTTQLQNNGMYNSYIEDLEVDPEDRDIVFAGGKQGLWKSVDGCMFWDQLNDEGVKAIAVDPLHPDTVYYGGQNLMRSYDGGITVEDIRHNVIGIILNLAVHPIDTNIIFVTALFDPSIRIYKSEDRGDSWNHVGYSGSGNFVFDPNYPDTIYCGSYRSLDCGENWEIFSPGNLSYTAIDIHPFNSDIIYAITSYGSHQNDLLVSYDWGENFQVLDSHTGGIEKIDVDNTNPDNIFYCTRNEGIHYSTDAGENWHNLDGFYDVRTIDIIPFTDESKVYIATNGDGVWLGEEIQFDIEGNDPPLVIKNSLLQNYPNPFHLSVDESGLKTTIVYTLKQKNSIELSIYNIKGELVKTLYKGKQKKGKYSLKWDGKDNVRKEVSTNVYLYTLRVGNKSVTKKMLLVR